MSVVLWATAPLAEGVAQTVPPATIRWSATDALTAAQTWTGTQGRRVAEGWSGVRRRITTLMPGAPAATADAPLAVNLPVRASSEATDWSGIDPDTSALAPGTPIQIDRTDMWREVAGGGVESFSLTTAGPLRRADGAPLPLTPREAALVEPQAYDMRYDYHWPAARTTTATGWQVDLTPHAGIGYGTRGGSAQAGATVRLGRDLEGMVPEGRNAFGDRGRWYLFAAGEGRAVGYNFARNRDGGFDRSGMSHDSGAFFGDATVGVAWRRGPMQTSVGLTYREIEAEGLRLGRDEGDEVEEGLLAFQLSIKPDW